MGVLKLGKGQPWAPFVKKEEWGALPEGLMKEWHLLQLPLTYVWFSYEDLLTKYQTTEHIKAVQMCQKEHMDEDQHDINYNFLVNPEGVIYEGRGWSDEPHLPPKFADLKYKCLRIVYIGDYSNKDPPWPAIRSGMYIVTYGLKEYFIKRSFKIINYREPIE